ncbi:DUF7547 family protein [Halococcus hamelinensis]|uniref:Uncharacterized protein n=1 Tax=Halococcus hamelinensis 100A6 TaxID=1132509 RepID=M0LT70_9EURY|nr:hypothetical protein [Halococcus hamelinensis]EMA36757.1 hypothetical protein C447_14159 [Halococcus hamelinensis 100A6]
MTDADRDREMERLAGDLSTTLADLRDELDRASEPPRGPLGLPRPPTPGEVLRFTDELAIPAVIAILEANIRALEAFQGALRLARAGDEVRGRSHEARARTETLSRGALDSLDDTLVDLQGALEGRPENPEARTLLDDARALRAEIDDRLRETEHRSGSGRGSPARDSRDGRDDTDRDPWAAEDDPDPDDDESVTIDVDAELDSIHDAIDEENGENKGNDKSEGYDGTDGNDEDQ